MAPRDGAPSQERSSCGFTFTPRSPSKPLQTLAYARIVASTGPYSWPSSAISIGSVSLSLLGFETRRLSQQQRSLDEWEEAPQDNVFLVPLLPLCSLFFVSCNLRPPTGQHARPAALVSPSFAQSGTLASAKPWKEKSEILTGYTNDYPTRLASCSGVII